MLTASVAIDARLPRSDACRALLGALERERTGSGGSTGFTVALGTRTGTVALDGAASP